MAVTLAHTFETGQASGTTVSAANSATGGNAFAAPTIGTGAGVTYFTSPLRGSLCLRCVTTGTASQAFVPWTSASFTAASRVYLRATIRAETISAGMAIMRLRGNSVQSARVVINATGRIELRDTGNSTRATSSAAMTAGVTEWRVALDLTVGASATAILYIFYSPTGTTPDETLTASAQNWGTNNIDEISWGFVGAVSNSDLLLDDVMVTSVSMPGPAEQSRSLSDTATVADTAARALATVRGPAETVTAADAAEAAQPTTRGTSDTVTAADAATGQISTGRAAADTVTAADGAARALALPRATGDTVTAADSVAQSGLGQSAGVADTVTAADTATRQVDTDRFVADAVAFSDVATRTAQSYSRSLPGIVTAADSVTATVTNSRAAGDTVTAADSATRSVVTPRGPADTVTAADTAARVLQQDRAAAAALTLVDAAFGGAISGLFVDDDVVLSDNAAAQVDGGRELFETLVFTDGVSRSGITRSRATAHAVAAADSTTRQLVTARTGGGGAQLVDEVTRHRATSRTGTITVAFTDSVTAIVFEAPLRAAVSTILDTTRPATIGDTTIARPTITSG